MPAPKNAKNSATTSSKVYCSGFYLAYKLSKPFSYNAVKIFLCFYLFVAIFKISFEVIYLAIDFNRSFFFLSWRLLSVRPKLYPCILSSMCSQEVIKEEISSRKST